MEDFASRAGREHRRSWEAWNATSVKPSLEWIKNVTRGPNAVVDGALLANFQTMFGKGIVLWNTLTKSLTTARQDVGTSAIYNARYNTERTNQPALSVVARQTVERTGDFVGITTASKGAPERHPYSNFADPEAGIIIDHPEQYGQRGDDGRSDADSKTRCGQN